MSLLCCGGGGADAEISAEEKAANKALDAACREAKEKDEAIIKMLLLGAGESGKSTVFKQMKVINASGYTDEERAAFKSIIHSNTIQSMKAMLSALEKLELDIPDGPLNESRAALEELNMNSELDNTSGNHIKTLWTSDVIQEAFARRNEYQLNDSAQYYFDKVDELVKSDYLPSEQDVLRSRVRTTGIVESDFVIKAVNFKMYDVGGQRNERRKWIHCFEDVHAVVFVASMSEYDQNLYEDETQNRMNEALQLFEQICNSKWFKDTAMILFLNKKDLFEEKIKKKDMTCLWPEYTGGCDYEAGSQFIRQKFIDKAEKNKVIYSHFTCATNTDNISFVFDSVVQIVLDQNMAASGLG